MHNVDTEYKTFAGYGNSKQLNDGRGDGCLLRIHPMDLHTGLISFKSNNFVIGREESCDLRVNQDAVSREHCRIERNDDGEFAVTDLNSTNGTFVNDTRVGSDPQTIVPGDSIRFGGQVYKFLTTDHVEAFHYEATYSMMTTDSLTGVANKRYFIDTLNRELRRSVRSETPLSVLMLDVDHFKMINDTHGHLVGDDVLREFTSRLQNELRVEDLIARYGGEEFLIMTSETSAIAARTVARRCIDVISETPFKTTAGDIECTVSIGGVTFDGKPSDITPTTLIGKADQKLYQAKQAGRNQYAD